MGRDHADLVGEAELPAGTSAATCMMVRSDALPKTTATTAGAPPGAPGPTFDPATTATRPDP